MAMTWNEAMATGVSELDRQHQEIIRQINAMSDAMKQGKGREEIGRLLDFLGRYTVDHFAKEEAAMVSLACPVAEANRQAHRKFVERFTELRGQLDQSGASARLAIEIHRELSDWLVKHIMGIDTKLRACAAEPAGAAT